MTPERLTECRKARDDVDFRCGISNGQDIKRAMSDLISEVEWWHQQARGRATLIDQNPPNPPNA